VKKKKKQERKQVKDESETFILSREEILYENK